MQRQDGSAYFVRLGTTVTTDTPTRYGDEEELPPPRKRRRRASFRLRPLTLIGLILVAWLVWAATTPGGINARLQSISDRIQNVVNDATTDPGLKRAANYYNQRYTQEGAYPKVVAADLRDDPDAGWGVGVTTKWCSNEAIVRQSLTGGGTISRLLLAGEDYGDVHGKEACPADLTNPLPWEKPK